MPESTTYTLRKLLRKLSTGDATTDEVAVFLIGDGKDETTVRAAIVQLHERNITNVQFLQAFGYN